jgi:hypothetical protein
MRQAAKDRIKDKDRNISGGRWINPFADTDEEKAIKAKRAEARRIRLAEAKRKRLEFRTKKQEPSNVGQEGLKARVAAERAKTESVRTEGGGNAVQINQNNVVATPLDTRTENDDVLNLNRSKGF